MKRCWSFFLSLFSRNSGLPTDLDRAKEAFGKDDYSTALDILTSLAERGNAEGQFCLGYLYNAGNGVPENYKIALKWYTRAAKQGNAYAQVNLAMMYSKGLGVSQNFKTAFKWHKLAAEQGDTDAQLHMGLMHKYGKGGPQNDKAALEWLTRAAEQGHDYAQFYLGLMSARGLETRLDDTTDLLKLPNLPLAHMWWNVSASQGNDMAREFRDHVEENRSPSQIEKAHGLALECVNSGYKGF